MKLNVKSIFFVIVAVALIMLQPSCKKDKILTTGGVLTFSTDTLAFDTVFTAAGSYTSGLLIYNTQSQEIVLSSVQLKNGANSYFHLNVNGFEGNNISNLKIPAHDSIYVFATVNINPTDTLTPFLVTDELVATLNGKQFSVPFTAYGQNAHYIISDSIYTNTTWLTDKPYVVLHSCVVGPRGKLNIPHGCKVYMHQDARFFVYGEFNVGQDNKTERDSVVFQGDRLDRAYFGYIGYPGEWGGIYLVPGGLGNIKDAVIKNCGGSTRYYNYGIPSAAIEVDTAALLVIKNSTVKNSIGYGILSMQGNVVATNCLVHTTGAQALAVIKGGFDSITNCTFANYGSGAISHATNGTVAILNYFNNGDGTWNPGDLYAVLTNCIVYGTLDSGETICDSLKGATATLKFNNCLLNMGTRIEPFVQMNNCIISQAPTFKYDPLFVNTSVGDFHLQSISPALGKGVSVPGVTNDLDGNMRPGSAVDIGCYQRQ